MLYEKNEAFNRSPERGPFKLELAHIQMNSRENWCHQIMRPTIALLSELIRILSIGTGEYLAHSRVRFVSQYAWEAWNL